MILTSQAYINEISERKFLFPFMLVLKTSNLLNILTLLSDILYSVAVCLLKYPFLVIFIQPGFCPGFGSSRNILLILSHETCI